MSLSAGIGLALSGGAVRGIAHIAVLEVLEENGIPVRAVAGTSAGSIVGALYAAGMPVAAIRKLALETGWTDLVRPTFPRTGFIAGEGIRSFMLEVLPVTRFESLKIPFAAVATDLRNGQRVVLREGSVARAVQASCSLPLIFTPARFGGRVLVDGGVASMMPVRAAKEDLGAERVVAVDVNSRMGEDGEFDSLFQIAFQLTYLYATGNARKEAELADVVVPVNAEGIPLYDLSKAEELLRRGREAAQERVPAIRALLDS